MVIKSKRIEWEILIESNDIIRNLNKIKGFDKKS